MMSLLHDGTDLAVVVILFEHAALGIHDTIRGHVVVGRGANALLSHRSDGGDGGGSAVHRPSTLRREDGAAVVNPGAARDCAVAMPAEVAPLRDGGHGRGCATPFRSFALCWRPVKKRKDNDHE